MLSHLLSWIALKISRHTEFTCARPFHTKVTFVLSLSCVEIVYNSNKSTPYFLFDVLLFLKKLISIELPDHFSHCIRVLLLIPLPLFQSVSPRKIFFLSLLNDVSNSSFPIILIIRNSNNLFSFLCWV